MKNFFRFLMAAILVSMSATAVAQCIHPNAPGPPRVWDGARGCYVPQGTPQLVAPVWNGGNPYPYGVPQPAYAQPYGQPYGMPYGGVPAGGGLSNCAVVGGLAGGTLGSLAKHHRGQAVILGALLGGVVGHTVCTNSAGQRVIVQQPAVQTVAPVPQYVQQPVFANPPVPAEQQVGGYAMTAARRTAGEPSDCDVGNIPGLQDIKNLSREQCQAIRDALRVNKPGHCRVGGVNYPELVDNEPGCLAKLAEVTAQANTTKAVEVANVAQSASTGPQSQVPRDSRIRACKLQKAPGTPVLAVSVPDPNNREWKVVPSNPGETCQEWKGRIETSLS